MCPLLVLGPSAWDSGDRQGAIGKAEGQGKVGSGLTAPVLGPRWGQCLETLDPNSLDGFPLMVSGSYCKVCLACPRLT